jgi:hypothetical protein
MSNNCKNCNIILIGKPGQTRYCSKECQYKHLFAWRQAEKKEQLCEHCGNKFMPKTRRKTRFCSIPCMYKARELSLKVTTKIPVRNCDNCSSEYQPTRSFQKYCGPKCRIMVMNITQRTGLSVGSMEELHNQQEEQRKIDEAEQQIEPAPGDSYGICLECGVNPLRRWGDSNCPECQEKQKLKEKQAIEQYKGEHGNA